MAAEITKDSYAQIADNIRAVREKIEQSAAQSPYDKEVTLMAVTKTVDADGDHFKGHEKMSLSIAQRIFEKLHFSNSERSCIKTMIENHDLRLTGDKIEIKKLLSKIGNEYFEDLLAVQRADAMAQNEALVEAKLDKLALIQREYETIVANNEPYLVKHLAVDGNDILELGIQGSAVGKTLAFLQDAVIADSGKNNRETLLKLVEARR